MLTHTRSSVTTPEQVFVRHNQRKENRLTLAKHLQNTLCMSSIDRLSIQGIRSFSPEMKQEIQFGIPLTLIVGSNGCGKTTIIECLKYSTTGDMPPNSKGGAFVFDPKMKGSKEVSAQVRLFIHATDQRKYSITRNLQTTLKGKSGQTFKTLESDVGRIEDNGTVTTMSTKAQGLDEKIPKFLGVSKAILEYVIFTHQEDSLWPLSEPSILKKRFDEIFQVAKFSKSIDILKNFKKESVSDCKTLQETVNYLKTDRNRSESTKLKISQLTMKIEKYETIVGNLKIEIDDIIKKQDTLFKSNQQYVEILSKLDFLENKKTLIQTQINTLQENLTPIENTTIDELHEELQNFEENLLTKESKIAEISDIELKPRLEQLDAKRSKYNVLIGQRGEYNQLLKNYEINKKQLQVFSNDLQTTYFLQPTAENVEQYYQDLVEDYEQFKGENEQQLESMQSQVHDLNTKQQVETKNYNFNLEDIARCNNTLKVLEKDLKNVLKSPLLSENRQRDSELLITEYKQKLMSFEADDYFHKKDLEIESNKSKIQHLEIDLENFQKKIIQSKQQSDLLTNYNLVKQDYVESKRVLINNFNITKNENEKNLNNCLNLSGVDIDPEQEAPIDLCKNVLSNYESSIDDADIVQASNSKKYESYKFEQQTVLTNIKTKKAEIKTTKNQNTELARKIEKVIPLSTISTYEQQVSDLEESEKELLEGIKAREVFGQFFQKSRDIAESSECCFLCERTFKDDPEGFAKFIKRLDSKLIVDVAEFVSEKESIESTLHGLKKISSFIQTYQENTKRLDNLQEDLEHLHNDLARLEPNLSNSKQIFEQGVLYADNLKKFRTVITSLERSVFDVEANLVKLEKLSKDVQLQNTNLDTYESIEELNKKQIDLNNVLKQLRAEIYDMQAEKESQTKTYNKLQQFINDENRILIEIENITSEKNKIVQEINIQNEKLAEFESSKVSKQEELDKINVDVEDAMKQFQELKASYKLGDSARTSKISAFNTIRQNFANLNKEVADYEEIHKSSASSLTVEIGNLESDINQLNRKIEEFTQYINLETNKLNDSKSVKNNIRFNIDCLNLTKTLDEISKEISNLDARNAHVQRDQYESEATALKQMYEQVSSDNASKVGEIKQLRNQILEETQLLNTEYKGIDRKYVENMALLQSKLLRNTDLESYSKIVEMSIIKYHATKMKEINRVLDELWRSTYVGSDITTINIKTEQITSARGRSYNYKVVMFKDGYELDMRGRCSAGQKVLASILIRLALSESFGSDCGVIALDEPTTNLDEDNIASLAQGLHNIIQARQHQKNFQIIIITHDEKFLRYMKASDFADGYFKVDRDSLSTSIISWVDIKSIYE